MAKFFDERLGRWVDTPGTTVNQTDQQPPFAPEEMGSSTDIMDMPNELSARPIPGPAPTGNLPAPYKPIINTPDSSRGTPFRLDPSAVRQNWQVAPSGQLTPSSRSGVPAPGPPTFAPGQPIPGFAGRAVPGALGALMSTTPTPAQLEQRLNNPLTVTDLLRSLTGQTDTIPVTQSGPGRSPSGPGPTPPMPPPRPPYLPFRGPVPAYLPQRGPQGARAALGSGAGPGSSPSSVISPSDVDLGHYRQSVGNARTPTWVPGGEDAPAPQMFRGPTTMMGAPNVAGSGPRGSQNYYIPGSAPMAPGDWTGTGPAAGPFVPPGANNMPSAAAMPMAGGRGGAPGGGYAPNAGMMNNAALGDQIMGGNTFGGRMPPGPLAAGPAAAPPAPPPMPPPRPTPGGFGYNPLSFFGMGP